MDADQPYPRGNPWYLEESRSLTYDPDKAKALLKAAHAVGTVIDMICFANLAYNRECAQIVQEMWNRVGFKVSLRPLDDVPLRETLKKGDFHGYIAGNSYRFDPDGIFERNLHSRSDYAQSLSAGATSATIAWWKRPKGYSTRPGVRSYTLRRGTS